MPQYAKPATTKHERDRFNRRRYAERVGLIMPTTFELAIYSNPVTPPRRDHTTQLHAWADQVAHGYIVR
jgi:hypothetical protein